jgi:hypothetical protein
MRHKQRNGPLVLYLQQGPGTATSRPKGQGRHGSRRARASAAGGSLTRGTGGGVRTCRAARGPDRCNGAVFLGPTPSAPPTHDLSLFLPLPALPLARACLRVRPALLPPSALDGPRNRQQKSQRRSLTRLRRPCATPNRHRNKPSPPRPLSAPSH